MKKRDHKALSAYVRTVADMIGLKDWQIIVDRDYLEADDTRAAICSPVYGRKLGHIQFNRNVRNDRLDEIRNTVVHELIHCHLSQVQSQVECDLDKILPAKADVLFYRSFCRNVEFAVDGLAAGFCDYVPAIVWPVR